MATNPLHDTASPSGDALHLLLSVFDAWEDLQSRDRPITPESVAHWLQRRSKGETLPLEEIGCQLAQLQAHLTDEVARDLMVQRRHLAALEAELRAQQRQLKQDHLYLRRMIGEVDRRLCDCKILSGKPPVRSLQ